MREPVNFANALPKVTDTDNWLNLLDAPGDKAAGERIFFTPRVPSARRHQLDGRGGKIGPDLTATAHARPKTPC